MSFGTLIAVGLAAWILSLTAGLLAWRWGWRRPVRRIWLALGMALFAILIGWLGFTRLRLSYSRTTNGQGWTIDSKWFFLASLILGVVALLVLLWNLRPQRREVAA
jgi:hypothetical protein